LASRGRGLIHAAAGLHPRLTREVAPGRALLKDPFSFRGMPSLGEVPNLLTGEAPRVPKGGKPAVSPGPVKSPGPRVRSNARTGGPRG